MVDYSSELEKQSVEKKVWMFKKMLSMFIFAMLTAIFGIIFIAVGANGQAGFSAFGIFLILISIVTAVFTYVCIKNYSFEDSTNEGFANRLKSLNQRKYEERLYNESSSRASKDILKARINSKHLSKIRI